MTILINEFDTDKSAIIEPNYCINKVDDFPKIGVSTFSKKLIDKFASLNGVEHIGDIGSANGITPIYKILYKNIPIAFFMSGVGGPMCTMRFEEVIAMGLEKLVLFGSCGVLDKNIADGHIVVPTHAVRDEGTSYHYIEPSDEIELDECSINSIIKTLDNLKYEYIKGKTWTTDAPYRETNLKFKNRKNKGCIVVEMECASMAAVAKFRNIKFAQFLYSADNLDCSTWEPRGLGNSKLSEKEKYMALAFECALNL
jgi:uridine phosphorylase